MDAAKQEPARLSHLDAARQMTFIARSAASWASELLTLPEVAHLPWPSANAERFAVEIETKIGFLVERSPSRREADLLEANNRYLQRARDAEQKIANLQGVIEALEYAAYAAHGRGYVQGFADSRWDESGDYNEDALTADLDREKMRDGWYDDALHTYRDAQTKAVSSVKAAP